MARVVVVALFITLATVLAGCAKSKTAPEVCPRFTAEASPPDPTLGAGSTFTARFKNCSDKAVRLNHVCERGIDLTIRTQLKVYPLDGPVANLTTPCTTAPPHVREVAAGETKEFVVNWEGTVADNGCTSQSCAKVLPKGTYSLVAGARDADTGRAYSATVPFHVI